MKRRLVEANEARTFAIETGAQPVVGVNFYRDSEPSPLSPGDDGGAVQQVPEQAAFEQIARLKDWRRSRDRRSVAAALADLQAAAREGRNIMEPSIACARAGVTTGEWGSVLREVFGEYRAPTGIDLSGSERPRASEELRRRVATLAARLGTPVRVLIGKPGLDGHSNGAEQIARRAASSGIEVCYEGIRQTPEEIAAAAWERKVHLVGLSVLSGAHVSAVRDVMNRMRELGLGHVPMVVGGIVPAPDIAILKQCGAAAVFTPKDFAIDRILLDLIALIESRLESATPRRSRDPGRRRQSALRRNAATRRRARR
jgi:(2R)-ethylmalonyl-CoA mutase